LGIFSSVVLVERDYIRFWRWNWFNALR